MPLDQQLIKDSKSYALARLDELQSTVSQDLLLVDNFIYTPLLEKLINYIKAEQSNWLPEQYQETKNRSKLNWAADTVLEEVHTVCESLTDPLNQIYHRRSRFLGITVWRDLEGYMIRPHTDQPLISMAIQIYLSESELDLSTKFLYKGKTIHPAYKKNSGYIQNNTGLIHFMSTPVPANHTRYSLYAIWTDS